jgi:hypothetical protein
MQMAEIFGINTDLVKKGLTYEFTEFPMVRNLDLNNDKMKKLGFPTNTYKENLHKSLKYIS